MISAFLIGVVVLLLITFYQRSNWTKKQKLVNILLCLFLFVLTTPLHEFCHFISAKMMNCEVFDYQLFTKFNSGKIQSAYVNFHYKTINQFFIFLIAPYLTDIIFAFISFFILKRKQIKNSFLVGLIFSVGLLFSALDIVINFLGYVIKNIGDWNILSDIIGHFWTWFIGIIMISITLFLTYRIFIIYKGFPENLQTKTDFSLNARLEKPKENDR